MFSRLAQIAETQLAETQVTEGYSPHSDYITKQQAYFDARPNMIPSATSGLTGFDTAIRTATTYAGTDYQPYTIKNPNSIFMQTTSPNLSARSAACIKGSIDELIADKNPSDPVGCGWVYTPNQNSPYPIVSRGALGDRNGPSPAFDAPSHRKWFFDLQTAKRTILMDKCKSLKTCADVDNAVYSGVCGFCTDTNQGIPINVHGQPLYTDPRASCTAESIVTRKSSCPVPVVNGPRAIIDRTCDPVNGRLSIGCLHKTVLTAGCTDKGALANSLAGSQQDVSNLSQSNSVQIYNRVANPPVNMNIFTGGNTTVANVLQEVKQIVANTSQAANTALGAAARDLCLQRGAINGYDPCNDLTDAAVPPFDIRCLQRFFLKMGGTARGRMYPSNANIGTYNALGTLGGVKQYWLKLMRDMKGSEGFTDYQTQSGALQDVLGIVPEQLISRAPYKQGIEVFWFVASPGNNPGIVKGFLKRTIETQFVQFQPGPSNVPQLGGLSYGCMLQLTDIRARADSSILFNITVDDGFWISVNQPAHIDEEAMSKTGYTIDRPGLFENLGYQGPTAYQSQACTPFNKSTPNIVKMYHEDAGGGWSAFTINNIITCSGDNGWNLFNGMYASLTCEIRAPFLCYEVSKRGRFEELRNPGLFGQFTHMTGLDLHTRSDEAVYVPGKKQFVRLNTVNSMINISNVAYQSWTTMTVAVRLQTVAVRESIINLAFGVPGSWFFNVIATNNGSTSAIHVEYRIGSSVKSFTTPYLLSVGVWYMFRINNLGTGMSIDCVAIYDLINNKGRSNSSITITESVQLWTPNGTWNPAPGQNYQAANIMLGTRGYMGYWTAMYGTSAFYYDVAWVHLFDGTVNDNDIYRDAMSNWIYTLSPSSYNNYSA